MILLKLNIIEFLFKIAPFTAVGVLIAGFVLISNQFSLSLIFRATFMMGFRYIDSLLMKSMLFLKEKKP